MDLTRHVWRRSHPGMYTYTLTSLLKLEVLEQLNATGILRIIFQASFSFSGQPFGKRSRCGRTRDGIDWNSRVVTDLHSASVHPRGFYRVVKLKSAHRKSFSKIIFKIQTASRHHTLPYLIHA